MGIEKYFSAVPKKTADKKPEKKKTTDANDDDDFQAQPATTKSKHFASKSVDPSDFFGSKPAPKSKPAAKSTTTKKTEPAKKAEPVKKEEPVKKKEPAKKAEPAKKEEPTEKDEPVKKTTAAKKAETTKKAEPTKKAAGKKRTITIDDEDDFEEDDNEKEDDDYEEEAPPQKKAKTKAAATKKTTKKEDDDKNDGEVVDKAKNARRAFFLMKNQEPPKLLGTRPEPVGAKNCLQGLTFVISGQYETLTKESTKDIIMRYGGRVTSAVSGKTNYLLRGRDAGESKLAKAKTLGTKILDEDGFYDLVESSSAKETEFPTLPAVTESKAPAKAAAKTAAKAPTKAAAKGKEPAISSVKTPTKAENNSQLWTEKYKPTDIKDIIGNKELVRRISEWLANWQEHYKKNFQGDSDEMNNFRALLISGPPGIGKTTTASVAARVNGYEPLEFNASDVRSKKILEESISEMMDNRTMTEFFQAGKPKKDERLLKGKKVVLIMDEVDGMSGGDRGGSAELAQLIRKTKIPVICICNDSRSTKVAPLLRVCFEAKFKRTPAAQIRSRILSIAHREGLRMMPNAVDELVLATQNDIRQIINILSTYKLGQSSMEYDDAKKVGQTNQKNSILGLFDIPLELLSSNGWRSKDLNKKAEVYFHDYQLSNLMIYENYLKSKPSKAQGARTVKEIECKEMDLIAQAAEAIADGDLVDSMIHGTVQHWSLMPVHSIFSCVRPAMYMEGNINTRINFPGWLGQNSKAAKYARALSDVQTRMRLTASGDKFEIRQNYIPTLNSRLFNELEEENFDGAMNIMDTYYLDRENLDILSDLQFAATGKAPLQLIPTKTKTAFTRAYNSKNHPILFQPGGVTIKKSVAAPKEDAVGLIVEDDKPIGDDLPDSDADEGEEDPEKEIQDTKYIKESKPKKRKATASKAGPSKRAKSKK